MPDSPDPLKILESQPLSQALSQIQAFATQQQLPDLAEFCRQELQGYSDRYPAYRLIPVSYFEVGGQQIAGMEPQYCEYPLVYGVATLEAHLSNGLAIKLPDQVLDFLSQTAKSKIANKLSGAHVSPEVLKQLLEQIKTEAITRLRAANS
jgi:AbiTii